MVLNKMKDIKLADFRELYQERSERKIEELQKNAKEEIIVINGSYASGKLKLAQTLAKFGSKDKNFHIFSISSENLYAKIELKAYLEMLQ